MGKHPDGLCDVCQVFDDIKHLLFSCDKYKVNRHKLIETLKCSSNQMTNKDIFKDKSNILQVVRFIVDIGIKV